MESRTTATDGHEGRDRLYSFYALYALWYEIGSGKEAYGTPSTVIVSHRRQEAIDRAFEECTFSLASLMVKEGKRLVLREINNACDSSLIPVAAVRKWVSRASPTVQECFAYDVMLNEFLEFDYDAFWEKCGWSGAIEILNAPFWTKYTDFWGGPKWVAIADKFEDLDAAVQRGKLLDIVYRIDILYDLQHNTGALFSKRGPLQVQKSDLDQRFQLRSVKSFLPFVPESVRNLITTSLPYLSTAESVSLERRRILYERLILRS